MAKRDGEGQGEGKLVEINRNEIEYFASERAGFLFPAREQKNFPVSASIYTKGGRGEKEGGERGKRCAESSRNKTPPPLPPPCSVNLGGRPPGLEPGQIRR